MPPASLCVTLVFVSSRVEQVSIHLIANEVKRQASLGMLLKRADPEELKALLVNNRSAVDRAVRQLRLLEEAIREGRVPRHGGLVAKQRKIPVLAAMASVATYEVAVAVPPSTPPGTANEIGSSRSRIKAHTMNDSNHSRSCRKYGAGSFANADNRCSRSCKIKRQDDR